MQLTSRQKSLKTGVLSRPWVSTLKYLNLITLLQRLILLLAGYIATRWFSGLDLPLSQQLLGIWNQWDSDYYLTIARTGYSSTGDAISLLAFMPVYPAAIKLVSFIIPNFIIAGLLVSWIAQVLGGFFLWELVRSKWDETIARHAVLYLFLFPTAYFLVVPYTESLFLMFVLASFYFAQKKRWVWAGICGAFACGTRLTGLSVTAGLLIEAWIQGRDKDFWKRASFALLSVAGLVVYLFINWLVSGDPLMFLQLQKEYWKVSLAYPWVPIKQAIMGIAQGGLSRDYIFVYWGTLTSALFAGGFLLAGIKKVSPSHQIYAWAGLLIPLYTSWLMSLPRFILPLFPIFIILAILRFPSKLHGAILGISFAAQVIFFSFYALNWWTF